MKYTPKVMREMAARLDELAEGEPKYAMENAADMLRDIADEMEATNYPEIPEGWKLVPIVPSAKMCLAARKASRGASASQNIRNRWKAMLAAAPSPKVNT
jgi:hypothetical protein